MLANFRFRFRNTQLNTKRFGDQQAGMHTFFAQTVSDLTKVFACENEVNQRGEKMDLVIKKTKLIHQLD